MRFLSSTVTSFGQPNSPFSLPSCPKLFTTVPVPWTSLIVSYANHKPISLSKEKGKILFKLLRRSRLFFPADLLRFGRDVCYLHWLQYSQPKENHNFPNCCWFNRTQGTSHRHLSWSGTQIRLTRKKKGQSGGRQKSRQTRLAGQDIGSLGNWTQFSDLQKFGKSNVWKKKSVDMDYHCWKKIKRKTQTYFNQSQQILKFTLSLFFPYLTY